MYLTASHTFITITDLLVQDAGCLFFYVAAKCHQMGYASIEQA